MRVYKQISAEISSFRNDSPQASSLESSDDRENSSEGNEDDDVDIEMCSDVPFDEAWPPCMEGNVNSTNQDSEHSNFLESLCTTDLLRLAASIDACLTMKDIERMAVAFGDSNLVAHQRKMNLQWEISRRYYCHACGVEDEKKELSKCCGKILIAWETSDICRSLKSFWQNNKDSIESLWNIIRSGGRVDSAASHGKIRSLIQKEVHATLHLGLSTDGVRVSATKSKVWPIVLCSMDLPRKDRIKKKNMIVVGILHGLQDPSPAVFNKIFGQIAIELRTFYIQSGVLAIVTSTFMDKPAQAAVYNFGHHSSKMCCPYCTPDGARDKLLVGENRKIHRNGTVTQDDARLSRAGFKGESLINEWVPIYETSIDPFHHFGEGIFKEIVNGILGKDKKNTWALLRDRDGTSSIEGWVKIPLPTGWKEYKGGRVDQGSIITNIFLFGVCRLSMTEKFNFDEANMICIGLSWTYLQMSQTDFDETDDDLLNDIGVILKWCGTEYHKVTGRGTIKWHEIMHHVRSQNDPKPIVINAVREGSKLIPIDVPELLRGRIFNYLLVKQTDSEQLVFHNVITGGKQAIRGLAPFTVLPGTSTAMAKNFVRKMIIQLFPEDFDLISTVRVKRKYPEMDDLVYEVLAKAFLLGFGYPSNHASLVVFTSMMKYAMSKVREDRRALAERELCSSKKVKGVGEAETGLPEKK